jgi:CheY-like chemotaxis protein
MKILIYIYIYVYLYIYIYICIYTYAYIYIVMDGIEATSRFRVFEKEQRKTEKDRNNKRLLMIGMSANSDDQTKQEAHRAGIDYFVTKV